jgi:hypothetical protein
MMGDMNGTIGTTIGISAGTPASWDGAGYALLTFTEIGLVGTIGDIQDKWGEDSFQLLKTGATLKTKTSKDAPSVALSIGYKPTDGGQILLKTAFDDTTADYSFAITMASGEIRCFQAKVMEYSYQGMDGKYEKLATNLAIQLDPDGNLLIVV